MARRHLLACLLLAALLSGCMLISGEQASSDVQTGSGNLSRSFVSAEGTQEQTIATGYVGTLSVIAIVSVHQGDLRVEVMDPDGSVVLSVQGRSNEQITRSGNVPTDAEGRLRYRVTATGARDGAYQILFQRQ